MKACDVERWVIWLVCSDFVVSWDWVRYVMEDKEEEILNGFISRK